MAVEDFREGQKKFSLWGWCSGNDMAMLFADDTAMFVVAAALFLGVI